MIKKLFAALAACAFVVSLAACDALKIANTPVSTVKAQQTLDLLQSTHKTVLRTEVIYITQPACGPKSPAPPFCASYAVGLKMKELDDKATKAIAYAQRALDTLGSNPAAIDAAITGARLAMAELQNFTANYEVKK